MRVWSPTSRRAHARSRRGRRRRPIRRLRSGEHIDPDQRQSPRSMTCRIGGRRASRMSRWRRWATTRERRTLSHARRASPRAHQRDARPPRRDHRGARDARRRRGDFGRRHPDHRMQDRTRRDRQHRRERRPRERCGRMRADLAGLPSGQGGLPSANTRALPRHGGVRAAPEKRIGADAVVGAGRGHRPTTCRRALPSWVRPRGS